MKPGKTSSAGRIIGINNPQQAVFPAVCFFFALHFEISRRARLVYTSYVAVTGITVTHENLYNHSTNVLDFYVSITPSDATDKSYSVTVKNNDGYGEYKVMKRLSNGFQLYSNPYNFYTSAGCTITITAKDGISKKITAIYSGLNSGAYWTVT